MAASYWQPDWFLTGWFPAVWFAPADDTGVPPEQLRPEFGGMGGIRYVVQEQKRKKPLPAASRDERDLVEMLVVITSSGIIL